jgi:competence protein ComEA
MGIAAAVLIAGVFGAKLVRDAEHAKADAVARGIPEGAIRVNINTATLTELESIPGIGGVLAKQIVAHRPYKSLDQLLEIRGIGPSSLEGLGPYVKIEGETEKLR